MLVTLLFSISVCLSNNEKKLALFVSKLTFCFYKLIWIYLKLKKNTNQKRKIK